VSRVTTVVFEMLLPGLAGHWLDRRWGTDYWALIGFAIGLPLGMWHLLTMVRRYGRPVVKEAGERTVPQAEGGDRESERGPDGGS